MIRIESDPVSSRISREIFCKRETFRVESAVVAWERVEVSALVGFWERVEVSALVGFWERVEVSALLSVWMPVGVWPAAEAEPRSCLTTGAPPFIATNRQSAYHSH